MPILCRHVVDRLAVFAFALVAVLPVSALAQPVGEVQGAGHRSPLEGEFVTIDGMVTFAESNGFFVQGQSDGDDATSDGIFVFTGEAARVAPGDVVIVEGEVVEFVPQQAPRQLPLTEIGASERNRQACDVNPRSRRHGSAVAAMR